MIIETLVVLVVMVLAIWVVITTVWLLNEQGFWEDEDQDG
jgi:hypothetical protein